MSDDDRQATFLDVAETLLNNVAGSETGSRWREQVNDQLTGEDDIDYDALVAAGITAGEQAARFRERSRAPSAQAASPDTDALVDVRDIYAPGGEYAGTRVTVSDPDAEAYLSASGEELAVRTGSNGRRVDLPQPTAGVESTTDDGAVVEYIAYVAGGVVDPSTTVNVVADADDVDEDDGE